MMMRVRPLLNTRVCASASACCMLRSGQTVRTQWGRHKPDLPCHLDCVRAASTSAASYHHSLDDGDPSQPRAPTHADTRAPTHTQSRLAALRKRLAEESPSLPQRNVAMQRSCAPHVAPKASPPASILTAPVPGTIDTTHGPPLTDTFGRFHSYLRISLTERCNLRCQYCMPEEGVELTPAPHLVQPDELRKLVRMLVSLGVRKVRLTGGEPTLRRDIVEIVEFLKAEGVQTVAMTSNGITLGPMLERLRAAGLTHVNISLDTLRRERFAAVTRRTPAHWDRAWATINTALKLGFNKVKVNAVVMAGVNDDEIPDMCRLAKDLPLEIRFIELMPFTGNAWAKEKFLSYADQLRIVREAFPTLQVAEPDDAHETSKLWTVPGFMGKIGFITSMSSAFCATCNRIRLTADGKLKVCLHGAEEMDLLQPLRSGASEAELVQRVHTAIRGKHFALGGHADMLALAESAKRGDARPMITIGG